MFVSNAIYLLEYQGINTDFNKVKFAENVEITQNKFFKNIQSQHTTFVISPKKF